MGEILRALRQAGKVAFRTREYAAMLGKEGYARLVLHRLKKRGEIALVKRGWWAFPDATPEAVASQISKPGYISFHSALFLHRLTTQTPRKIQVAVARGPKKYRVFGMEVIEYRIKGERFTGFQRTDGVMLASPEKAFADALMLPRSCPEIVLAEAVGSMDLRKLGALLTPAAERRLRGVVRHAKQE